MTEKLAKQTLDYLIKRNTEIFKLISEEKFINKKIELCKEAVSNQEKISVLEIILCYV
jgi:hypothetical protein